MTAGKAPIPTPGHLLAANAAVRVLSASGWVGGAMTSREAEVTLTVRLSADAVRLLGVTNALDVKLITHEALVEFLACEMAATS